MSNLRERHSAGPRESGRRFQVVAGDLDEERHRAALSAAATELFEQEEDDDQPIFGVPEEEVDAEVDGDGDSKRDGRRRRRRRRGRGKREDELGEVEDDLPSYTLSDAPADLGDLGVEAEEDDEQAPAAAEPSQRPARAERDRDRDRSERDRGERDRGERDRGERDRGEREADLEGTPAELGRSLADNVARALSGFDRSRGPVSLQNVADAVRRKLRGNGELSLTAGAVAAAVAADNLRAEREGRVPRFRIGGGRVALAEWSRDRRAEAQHRSERRRGMHINLAIGYGGRNEIVDAVRAILRDFKEPPASG